MFRVNASDLASNPPNGAGSDTFSRKIKGWQKIHNQFKIYHKFSYFVYFTIKQKLFVQKAHKGVPIA